MKKIIFITIVFSLLTTISCAQPEKNNTVIQEEKKQIKLGSDRLIGEFSGDIKNKRLGIVTNHTGTLSNGVHVVDTLHSLGYEITALFGPEHGIRGDAPAGEKIKHGVDAKTGIPAFSLYGETRKPDEEMLKDVDVLIFDIQDVGARFYTYISTLFYILQAGAEQNIPVIVLDRPNPINGVIVEGPIREENFASFVGIAPIPIRHGMTVGELAKIFSGEGWIGENLNPDLTVIEMDNWQRDSFNDEYDLQWLPPSPNIPNLENAIVYPGTCLIEGINVSEGRGTMNPFLIIGAPYINSKELIERINSYGIEGVELRDTSFIPVDITGMVNNPKHKSQKCYGIFIEVTGRKNFKAVDFGVKLISAIQALYPDELEFRDAGFDRLSGTSKLREMILKNMEPSDIISSWEDELNEFKSAREKYLIY